jgi:uncharacterized phage protein (TIGR01671 family)
MKAQNNVTVQDQDGNSSKPLLSSRLFFRAWISSQNYMAIQGTPDLETLQSFMFHYGNEENIMQFTGLSDKNGSKIFEGDIVSFINAGGLDDDYGVIYFCETRFKFAIINEKTDLDEDLYNITRPAIIKVIGNVFENPELL